MLDQSLLQSHFIGRDGFRWWIGQIPPVDVWKQQNEDGWGLRYKVRILGYHPIDDKTLKNEDLPWAQVMLPTTAGSGGANLAQNPKLTQGDIVVGFFMDGDNGQIPMIMGLMGRTDQWSTQGYKFPFESFTGYTKEIKKPNGKLHPDQSLEQGIGTQPTPIIADPATVQKANQRNKSTQVISAFSAVGQEIVFADTCEDTSMKTIKNEVNNLLKVLQDVSNKLSDYKEKINAVADIITSSISWIVGKLFDALYNALIPLIQKGLQAIYKSVYASVFAASGNPGVAHQAGVASNAVFLLPVKKLEEAIACVAANVINGLRELIKNLLYSLLENAKRFVTCAAEQFLGSLLNSIIGSISSGLSSALGGISKLISTGFSVANFLRSGVDLIKSIGGLFDCNQSKGKCSGKAKEWVIGRGPKDTLNTDNVFSNILQNANNVAYAAQDVANEVSQFPQTFDEIKNSFDIFNGKSDFQRAVGSVNNCFTGFPSSCGPPRIKIFGGGGKDAVAIPVFGFIQEAKQVINNVRRTASVIGAVVTNKGSGYQFPPFVEITDECGNGYGAIGRSIINENGEVVSIYIVVPGEGYPVGDTFPSGVTDVYIDSPGIGYSDGDTASDDLGNTYSLTIDEFGSILSATPINIIEATEFPVITINTETGVGAILKPIFGSLEDLRDARNERTMMDTAGVQGSEVEEPRINGIPRKIKKQVDCPI
jgi:hypothetical protein